MKCGEAAHPEDILAQLLALKQELSSFSTVDTAHDCPALLRHHFRQRGSGRAQANQTERTLSEAERPIRDPKSMSQRDLRGLHRHAGSPMPVGRRRRKSASSLDFEVVAWKRAADKRAAKKTQLEKRAALHQLTTARACRLAAIRHHLKTNACANRAIKQCTGFDCEHDVRVCTIKSDELLEWRGMATLTLFTASIACLFCALWAV
jgi:hypothetical protein